MTNLKKALSAAVWSRYSITVDLINNNAKLYSWIRSVGAVVPKVSDRLALYKYVSNHFIMGGPIDYLEFGVFRGDTVRAWTNLNGNPDSRFIGFDSFEGLPERMCASIGKGAFDVGGAIPQIPDDRVQFVKGWFQRTVPAFLKEFSPRSRLVIHNDSDLYSSTLYTLARLNDIMVPGTIIIFDEFASPLHEFRALNDYLSAFTRTVTPLVVTKDGSQIAFEFDARLELDCP
jgi:O-methyltransferase